MTLTGRRCYFGSRTMLTAAWQNNGIAGQSISRMGKIDATERGCYLPTAIDWIAPSPVDVPASTAMGAALPLAPAV